MKRWSHGIKMTKIDHHKVGVCAGFVRGPIPLAMGEVPKKEGQLNKVLAEVGSLYPELPRTQTFETITSIPDRTIRKKFLTIVPAQAFLPPLCSTIH